jgi:hypothetical protein
MLHQTQQCLLQLLQRTLRPAAALIVLAGM